jgi:ABC-type transporter Mla subunit MlaD
MALQDLTPELRTRLNRMERAVGWFVLLAAALLVFGFGYYLYQTARSKGWFKTKAAFFIFVETAEGLKVGDPVKLMGFDAGRITEITPMDPMNFKDNVYVAFELLEPNYGYMWTEGSRAKVDAADFLGQRVLEVTKGTGGHAIYISFPVREVGIAEARNLADTNWRLAEDIYDPGSTQLIARAFRPLTNLDALVDAGKTQIRVLDRSARRKRLTAVWNEHGRCYDVLSGTNKPFWLRTDESPALTERLEALVAQVETALPGVLSLTNQIAVVLSNSAAMTANFSEIAAAARPAVSNLNSVTAQLNHPGALGEWLLPTNINDKLDATLAGANTNLVLLAEKLAQSLDNLAGITSNLDRQVQANTNMLSGISRAVVDADDLMQGLKRHWLLRSAFKHQLTNAPAAAPAPPSRATGKQGRR